MAVLRCIESFFVFEDNGVPRLVEEGKVFDDKDPACKKFPRSFEPVEVEAMQATSHAIEAATAAPGEKRPTRKATKAVN